MTFSSLISGTIPHHNKLTSRNGSKVSRVIQHHWAGTTGGDARLGNPKQKASANYLIFNDGTIKGQVPEEYRAWTSGGYQIDRNAITIEVANSKAGGNWPISAAALNSLIRLLADIAKRYRFGSMSTSNYRGHREFQATACPGPYLWSKRSSIIKSVNDILGGKGSPAPKPKPTPKPKPGTKAPIATVKAALKKMGLPQTAAGVASYQRAHGLHPDGVWGSVTRAYYHSVKKRQQYLNKWKAVQRIGKLVVDGYWGNKSKAAERAAKANQTKSDPYKPPAFAPKRP